MTNSKAKAATDKQRFFADLDHLDDSDEATEDELDIKYSPQVSRSMARADRAPHPSKGQHQHNHASYRSVNQLPLQGSSEAPINLQDTPHLHTNDTKERISLPLSPTRPAPRTGAETADPLVKPLSKRQGSSLTRNARFKKTKKTKDELKLVPEEGRIFDGLVFFFVPNDDVVKSRRLRILRAREHGAQRATEFNGTVTHVIVEQDISYQEASKAFPNRHIPEKTILVRTSWLSESLDTLYLRDVYQSRFLLKGAPVPSEPAKGIPSSSRPQDVDSRQLHSIRSPSREIEAEDDKNGKSNVENEFQSLVKQVKEIGCVPSDIESDSTFSFSSTVPESAYESDESLEEGILCPVPLAKENKGFQCMEANTSTSSASNPNHQTITILQEMTTHYDRTGDHWRTTAYRKAISALCKQDTLISTRAQAQAIPQIGARIADKIEEIVSTNKLRRLENARNDPQDQILQQFMGIYGVGHKQASQWIAQGHRTLSDLLEKASLTPNQKIGIDHYVDFTQRIPREEVAQHAEIVRKACRKADPGLEVIIGGSYRRGSTDSGDIDLIITKSDADLSHIHTLITQHVIPSLFESDFLKCTLVSPSSSSSNSPTTSPHHNNDHTGSKFHGSSTLPPTHPNHNNIWRRIDFLFTPPESLGASLLYFTGNDIFNRSMRLLARKKGMRLNQHGLYEDVVGGVVVTTDHRRKRVENDTQRRGTLVEGRSEKRIFEVLGVPWREPWERIC